MKLAGEQTGHGCRMVMVPLALFAPRVSPARRPKSKAMAVAAAKTSVACTWAVPKVIDRPSVGEQFPSEAVLVRAVMVLFEWARLRGRHEAGIRVRENQEGLWPGAHGHQPLGLQLSSRNRPTWPPARR